MALAIDEHLRVIAIAVVFDLAAENFLGALQRLATLPLAHGDGVTGLAHSSWAPIAADQQRVFVDPRHGLLAAWEDETALHKFAHLQVELAQGICVLTARGQRHETEFLIWLQAVQPMPHPALL